jgi:hypothetical protein
VRLTPLDAGDTASIYAGSLSDLPRLAAKALIAKARPELISARILLSRYFRLFQQNRTLADVGQTADRATEFN